MTKQKIIGGSVSALVIITGIGLFFNSYTLHAQTPVKLKFQVPVYATHRKATVITIMAEAKTPTDVNPLTPDQQYLCNKFGPDCKIALAIFRAESGLNAKAINVNKNGSVDFGCMQINSIHLSNIDTSSINLLNCRDNIDVAYKIFSQQKNFSAWAAFQNGSYKKYLIN
jgi:hypothetical protein